MLSFIIARTMVVILLLVLSIYSINQATGLYNDLKTTKDITFRPYKEKGIFVFMFIALLMLAIAIAVGITVFKDIFPQLRL